MEIVFMGVTVTCCRGRRRHHGLADEEPAEQEPLHYFNTNDDYARSQIRSEIPKRYPPIGDMFALDATLETDLRNHLLPVFLRPCRTSPRRLGRQLKAIYSIATSRPSRTWQRPRSDVEGRPARVSMSGT